MIHQETHIRTLEAEFRSLLNTKHLGQIVRFYKSTDSTNIQAMQWAGEDVAEGALVVAEHQTAGKGRHGRSWEAQPSSNLLFSLILRPQLALSSLSLITVSASIALAETIDHFISPLSALIKWPNDILINGKKCCGMLLESIISNQYEDAAPPVVLGIGVNLNQEGFSDKIAHKTTSLLLEAGRHIPRMAFLTHFLSRFENYYVRLSSNETSSLIQAYQMRLAFLNEERSLKFVGRDETVCGIIRGVTEIGALKLQTKDGIMAFHAGEVTSQEPDNSSS